MVAKRHQGGEEFEDDCGIDKVDLIPYGIGNPVGARGRGGEGFGEYEFNLLFGEGDS